MKPSDGGHLAEGSKTPGVPAGQMLAAALAHYGLDARALSALRAYSAYDAGEAAFRKRIESLEDALLEAHAGSHAHLHDMRRFTDLFASLPEANFATDWLQRLADAWQALRRNGGPEDLPLRAARIMVAHGFNELLRERSSLSVLEVEIAGALTAAAMCTAELLVRMTALHSAKTVGDDASDHERESSLLSRQLAAAIDAADGQTLGLLMLRMRIGAGTLTLSREQRDTLWEGVLDRVLGLLRENDILVRAELHGCAIILPSLQMHAQVLLAANKLSHALETPLPVGGTVVRAAFALGAVWSPAHGLTAEDLIRCGDLAVEAAQRDEKPIVVFDDQMLAIARREALIEKEFPSALENGQLSIHVQPQVDLSTGQCIGGELLLRWTDSQGNPVPPYRIPEVAKRIGAAPQLTRWLILSACRTLADLNRAGVELRLSANLMGRDVMDPELPLLVEQATSFWRVSPSSLTFELTEGMMLEDPAVGAAVMRRLIDLGASTSIDDFGIGYSSILYLRQLPLHELKVDCVFVTAMSRSQQDREIVASLVKLSHALGLQVVAEGVEDEETMVLLREMGCDRGQGYWISRAMPTADFAAWVRDWNSRHA